MADCERAGLMLTEANGDESVVDRLVMPFSQTLLEPSPNQPCASVTPFIIR